MMLLRVVPETYVSPEEQLLLFAGACLLGIPCGLLFDSCRICRRLLPHHPAAVAAEDIIFLSLSGFMILGYISAFGHGEFRMYYVIGTLAGFILYECTLGRVIVAVGGFVCRFLQAPLRLAGRGIATICRKVRHIFVESSKKTKKVHKNVQNDLQEPPEMVYNNNGKL